METRFPPPGRKGGVPQAFLLPILKAGKAEFAKAQGIGLVLNNPFPASLSASPQPFDPPPSLPSHPNIHSKEAFPLSALSSMETCCLATTSAFLITSRD